MIYRLEEMSIPARTPGVGSQTKVKRTKMELRGLLAVSYNEYQGAMAFVER